MGHPSIGGDGGISGGLGDEKFTFTELTTPFIAAPYISSIPAQGVGSFTNYSATGQGGYVPFSENSFAISATKKGTYFSFDPAEIVDMLNTQTIKIGYLTSMGFPPSSGWGIDLIWDHNLGAFSFNIGNHATGESTNGIPVTPLLTDVFYVCVDDSGANGSTVYLYQNQTLLGTHELTVPIVGLPDMFAIYFATTKPVTINIVETPAQPIAGTTQFGTGGAGGVVDTGNYPLNSANSFVEAEGMTIPLMSTGGLIFNGDIGVFNSLNELIEVLGD